MQSQGISLTPLPPAPRLQLRAWNSRKPAVYDRASLGSEPREPTKQSLSFP